MKILKFSLVRVKLNPQGYDSKGIYHGKGQPLYYFNADHNDLNFSGYIRAVSRTDAKQQIKHRFHNKRTANTDYIRFNVVFFR